MIRINLVQKKQPSYVNSTQSSSAAGGKLNAFKNLGAGGFSEYLPLLKSLGIPIVIGIAANSGYSYYTDQRNAEMAQESTKLENEKVTINAELKKIKGFETVKVELERNELVLRTKIDTIEKLIRGREFTVKSLVTLAQSMPRDIWMTEVSATETGFEFKGGTVDLSLVSDFMSKLGQTIYYRDVTLKSTASDPNGKQAIFDLTARRD